MATQNPYGTLFAKNGDGTLVPVAANYANELHVMTGGRQLFMGANPSGVTTSAGLATTYVGLCLSNPAGNASGGKPINLMLRRVSGVVIVAPAAVLAFNLITGYAAGGVTVHTTALTPFSAQIGTGPAPTAKLDSACTLVGTPVWSMPIGTTPVATDLLSFNIDLCGAIIIPPGGYVAIGTNVTGPVSGFQGGFSWEEVVT